MATGCTGQDLSCHYFINHAFHVIGILFGCTDTGKAVKPLLEKILTLAEKEGLGIFPVVGPTVTEFSDVGKSYTFAEKYTSARLLGYTSLYCSDFPEVCSENDGWAEKMSKLCEGLSSRTPLNSVEIARDIMACPAKGTPVNEQRLKALSIAENVFYTVQSNPCMQRLPDSFIQLFKGFCSIGTNELQEWIGRLIMHAAQILSDKQDLLHPYVRKSIEFIHSGANGDISLKTIAAKYNVSPAYLGQLFKVQTGKYFNDYLTSVRLEQSKRLIAETNMKVSDIAKKVGFSSQTYFNRTFKQTFGSSPIEYRYATKAD
jgi:AraC-like DNA-binding protein